MSIISVFLQLTRISYNEHKDPDLLMQKELLLKVRQILSKYPKSGLYKSELRDKNERFAAFMQFCVAVQNEFDREEGPRGELTSRARTALEGQHSQVSLDLLKQIDCTPATPLRDIIIKLKEFEPCEGYKAHKKTKKLIIKMEETYRKISDEGSEIRQKIYKGMLDKSQSKNKNSQQSQTNQNKDCFQPTINDIVESKRLQIEKQRRDFLETENKLNQNHAYRKYIELKELLKPFMSDWFAIDSKMGKDAMHRGKTFEDRCQQEAVVSIIRNKLKIDMIRDCEVHKNVKWAEGKGEADFVVMKKGEQKVVALIEVKARLFDIAAGYSQGSGEERQKTNKLHLLIANGNQNGNCSYNKIVCPYETPCFVVTCLSSYDYHLGFESKLKEDFVKLTKNIPFSQITKEKYLELFEILYAKHSDRNSPKDWFDIYSRSNLYVLPVLS